ncbi:MAG: calcium-binding protein [Alphaproteobacteria bacterium]|nr:calcium-binding protein [Alphaproteobacteria bacterium]
MANINGNNNANTLIGTAFADNINARGGNDYVDAGDGNDYVDGGNGNDILKGGLGHDQMFGGANNDRLNGGEGDDALDGGTGIDWADFDGGAAVNVDLTAGIATGQGTDTLVNFENVLGSSFGDRIKGTSGNNTLDGAAGDDTFVATSGTDVIIGGLGGDTINFSALTAGVTSNLTAYSSTGATGTLSGIENITGSALADTLTGDAGDNVIDGGLGNDIINGGAGVDTAVISGNPNAPFNQGAFANLTTGISTGGAGTDTLIGIENLTGSDFKDQLTGNAGNNVLNGGASSDALFATQGIDVYDGSTGNHDTVYFTNQPGATANLATGTYAFDANNHGTLANIDDLVGGTGNDSFTGNAAANVLDGMDGSDTLAGGLGNDGLYGGAGSDVLIADGGNDILSGDYSYFDYGDDASDTFVIGTNAGTVTINDFTLGVDKLDVSAFSLGTSNYWTASAEQSALTVTTLTLTGQNQEVVTIDLRGIPDGYNLSLNDMIGGSTGLIAAPPAFPDGNGFADVFTIQPQSSGRFTQSGFEDGLDMLDLTFLNQPGWQGAQGAAYDGSVLFDFWNTTTGDAFELHLPGVGFGLITQADIII